MIPKFFIQIFVIFFTKFQEPQHCTHSWGCTRQSRVTLIVKKRLRKSSFSTGIITIKALTGKRYRSLVEFRFSVHFPENRQHLSNSSKFVKYTLL